ncbi:hypothetical protein ACHAWF_016187 [Thalassiosira exigua]
MPPLPSSSSLAFALSASPPSPASADVAVVGCGVLGSSLCRQILSSPHFASRTIVGVTKTEGRHEALRKAILGEDNGGGGDDSDRFRLTTMDDLLASPTGEGRTFRDVVFCAPPSGFDDYPSAVRDAATELWAGSDSGGSFVFTSSGGVYEGADGETVDETHPTLDPEANPRQGRMVYAEREAVGAGGCALRLAGLYTLERGAHNYWLERCQESGVQGREDGIVNLLHYDDAASACLAALAAGPAVTSGKTFLISEGNPTTRKGICESALKHDRYAGYAMPKFNGGPGDPRGKIYDGTKTNEALKWKPVYNSFDEFMTCS